MGANLRKNVKRRQARLQRQGQAVSPVVATLILILVAVAAAAALYLWLVAWQGSVTGTIGQPTPQTTLTIGGSTSVYPFDAVAVPQFEANNSGIAISNNQGGTGAGMLAVCHGSVDIGTSSSLQTVAGLETNDQCPSTTVITTVAYDAVDVTVAAANPHGLQSISYDTLTLIYDRASTSTPTLVATTMNGLAIPAGLPAGALQWADIPAAVAGAVLGTNPAEQLESGGAGSGGAACPAPFAADICAVTPGTTPTPCGWSICASGAVNIDTVARSDASGTTQSFEARLLGATSATGFATSVAGLGFSGCGSNNLIADCGMTSVKSAEGNPAVISTVAGDVNAIGYASDGLIKATGSGVIGIAFLAPGQTAQVGTGYTNGGVFPSTGATGTIAQGINGVGTAQYAGWRPFEFVTTNTPTGEAQRFIQFVLDPANNLNLASESFEVSIYSI
jgi:ABC-type phosphate transport system substrate-binding protein